MTSSLRPTSRALSPPVLLLLVLHLSTTPSHASDPTCDTGLVHHDACCPKTCGRCSGPGCSSLPGGADDCCSGPIEKSGRSCDTSDPPCVIAPANHTNSTTAILSLGGGGGGKAIATVAPEFVSFTFDASQWRKIDLNGSNAGGGYGGTLDTLVRGLLPAHLRVGGTQGDYDVYTGFASEKGTTGYFPVGSACGDLPSPMTDYRCRVRVWMLCVHVVWWFVVVCGVW